MLQLMRLPLPSAVVCMLQECQHSCCPQGHACAGEQAAAMPAKACMVSGQWLGGHRHWAVEGWVCMQGTMFTLWQVNGPACCSSLKLRLSAPGVHACAGVCTCSVSDQLGSTLP
jgi:hypothetical protein